MLKRFAKFLTDLEFVLAVENQLFYIKKQFKNLKSVVITCLEYVLSC